MAAVTRVLNLLERHLLTRLIATPCDLVMHADLLNDLASVAGSVNRHRLELLVHRLRRKVEHHFRRSLRLRSVRGSGYVMRTDEERSVEGGISIESE